MSFDGVDWTELPAAVRQAVDADRVGAAIVDTSRIIDSNDHYLRIVGYNRAELEAGEVSWLRLTPPQWLADDARTIGELRTRRRAAPYEKEYVRRDGTLVRVWIGTRLLSIDPLRILAIVATAGDLEAEALVQALGA
jgi:PAS domain S-box-containing protein